MGCTCISNCMNKSFLDEKKNIQTGADKNLKQAVEIAIHANNLATGADNAANQAEKAAEMAAATTAAKKAEAEAAAAPVRQVMEAERREEERLRAEQHGLDDAPPRPAAGA